MTCNNCGKDVIEGAIFCSYCGTKLPVMDESAKKQEPKDGAIRARIKSLASLPNLLYILLLIFAPIGLHFSLSGSKGVRLAAETVGLTSPALITVILYNYLKGGNKAVNWISTGMSVLLLAVILLSIGRSVVNTKKAEVVAPDVIQQQGQVSEPATDSRALSVNVSRSQSAIVTMPETMERVHLADPNIADVKVMTPTKLEITGKAAGTTPLTVLDQSGQTALFSINVN